LLRNLFLPQKPNSVGYGTYMVHVLILSLDTTRPVSKRNLRGRREVRVDQFIWGKIKEGATFAADFEIFTNA